MDLATIKHLYTEDAIKHAKKVSDGTRMATYVIKDVCGTLRAYPVNDMANTLQDLSGHKTLRTQDIKHMEKLGFQVVTIHGERIYTRNDQLTMAIVFKQRVQIPRSRTYGHSYARL